MEDDDGFGDLYSDILSSSTTSLPSQLADVDASKSSQNRPIDEEILCGALQLKNSNSVIGVELDASTRGKALTRKETPPDRRGFDLNLDASGTVGGNIPRVEAWGLEKCEGSKGTGDFKLNFMEVDDDLDIGVEELEEEDDEFAEKDVNFLDKLENVNGSADKNKNVIDYVADAGNQDEWESDESEDDLQIVLNDDIMPDKVDGEEALVIVADDGGMSHGLQQTETEARERGGEEERKESDNAAKTNVVGGTAAPTAMLPKIGYSNHVYHQPFHSQFKYVRPCAASTCGAASLTPGAGQVRPPITLSVAGRRRGDWPPAAVKGAIPMQTGFQAGYGMPVRGAKAALRNYDCGLDFTLPSHKTIFEVDIDRFEEKPCRNPGMDVSDFFNFGLNEEGWKDYCKTLELLRVATSMQGKIHVHEIGRAEEDYDPDLSQELAVVVGITGIPSENANPGKAYPGTTDAYPGTTDLARENGSAPLPIGRPIPVETGTGDRVPSIETRRPRLHDSDTVIEIVCQRSADDDDTEEQQDNDSAVEDEVHDPQQDDVDRSCHSSHAYNGQKTKQLKNTENRDEIGREESLHVVSEAAGDSQPHTFPHEERSAKGRANSGEKNHVINGQNNSSSLVIGSDGEQAAAVVDDNDVSVAEDRSFDTERKDAGMGATTKQKGNADVEQVSQEFDDREDSKPSRSSEDDNPKTGIKDQRKSDDKLKGEGHHPRTGSSKKSVGDEDDARRNRRGRDEIPNHSMAVREREDSRSCKMHMKSESMNWRKESDISERSWRLRDEDFHGRRQRNWDGNSKLQNEKVDILPNKRRRDGDLVHAEKEEVKYNQREGSTHRKRERDNSSDQWRIDGMHNVRQKLEPSLQSEWGRQIDDDEWRRHRQLHEEKLSVMRSGRPFEDRTWNNHYQKSDDYGRFGRKYHPRDVAQYVVDDYARGYRGSNEVMRARYRRVDRNDTHVVHTFHTREERIGYISEKVNLRSTTKRGSGEDDIRVNEEASADDFHAGSRRGDSNSEHWTSHKERGFGITPISSCSLNRSKDPKEVSEEPWHKLEEENRQPSLDDRKNGGEMNNTKVGDNHLDAVKKLKKHSERFKFAMPREKEAMAMKSESLPSSQTENRTNSAVETARPARKRRWGGN